MTQVIVVGNLGRDAELVPNNGKPFISFNLADTDKWKDEAGQEHSETTWYSCAYNGSNEALLPYLKKGKTIMVTAHRLATRVYSSPKERRMVAGINLSVSRVELLGGSTDSVPHQLIDPQTAMLVDVDKFYWTKHTEVWGKRLINTQGQEFECRTDGWIAANPQPTQEQAQEQAQAQQATERQPTQEQAQKQAQAQQATEQQLTEQPEADAPFTGTDTPEQIAAGKTFKKQSI